MKVCTLFMFRYIEFATSKKLRAVNLVLTFSQVHSKCNNAILLFCMVYTIIMPVARTVHESCNTTNIDSITKMSSSARGSEVK